MDVEARFIEAARHRRLVRLVERTGEVREVEPYLVFVAPKGQRRLHFYQVRGDSRSAQPQGWKVTDLERVHEADVLGESFSPRGDYNPFNERLFPQVVFALPTRDGRVRREGEAVLGPS